MTEEKKEISLTQEEAQLLLQAIDITIKNQQNAFKVAQLFSNIVVQLDKIAPQVEKSTESAENKDSKKK